jgi:hypothetical protein
MDRAAGFMVLVLAENCVVKARNDDPGPVSRLAGEAPSGHPEAG